MYWGARINNVGSSVRCKECSRTHAAMQRLFQKEPALRAQFNETYKSTAESRTAFITRSRGLVGDDLKKLVQTAVTETRSQHSSSKRKTRTDFLDSPDLKKCLVGKPDELQRILDSGPSFEHPDTGAQMYALTSFTEEHPHYHLAMLNQSMSLCHPMLYNPAPMNDTRKV